MTGSRAVVLGVDVGTTASKAIALDEHGSGWGQHRTAYDLSCTSHGYSVQAPKEIVDAALTSMREAVSQAACAGKHVVGVGLSAAMHGLVGVDSRGRPITPLLTWADSRASEQAARMRRDPSVAALHRRTGTPVHAMSPLVKLIWFRETEPQLFSRVSRWVGIKDLLAHRLTGTWVTDHSTASGTGLFNLANKTWDAGALDTAGICVDRLPELLPTTSQICGKAEVVSDLGLHTDVPLVIGAGDGPLANLGVGAVETGVAACSLGTSGAVRIVTTNPTISHSGELFCYVLDEDRWVVGGAVSNGGLAFRWAHDVIFPDSPGEPDERFFHLAEEAPPGCEGLVMLPYLVGERFPCGIPDFGGAYLGLRPSHDRRHLARAAVEGVCQQLALVLDVIRASGLAVDRVIATGGATRSPFVQQLLADVLATPVAYTSGHEGSAVGAVLLAMSSLGLPHEISEVVGSSNATIVDPSEQSTIHRRVRARLLAASDALQALPAFV